MITKQEILSQINDLFEINSILIRKERILTSNLSKFLKQIGITDIYPVISDWKCEKSPVDYCVYNQLEDPYHDSCLFCGQPEERK